VLTRPKIAVVAAVVLAAGVAGIGVQWGFR
jgi:hypothetical protein